MSDDRITLDLDGAGFDEHVLQGDRPALVAFSASWCAPCRALAPVVDGLAADFAGRATVGRVDIDSSPELVERYSVASVPTLLLFQKGRLVERLRGLVPARDLERRLAALTDRSRTPDS